MHAQYIIIYNIYNVIDYTYYIIILMQSRNIIAVHDGLLVIKLVRALQPGWHEAK
jgi:hypothetical protein